MVGTNYSITHSEGYTTLSTCMKGTTIPLVSSKNSLEVEGIYRNIQSGAYKNARELCEDIQRNFSLQATMLVLVTLESATPVTKKYKLKQNQ